MKIVLHFGALCAPIHEQLGLPKATTEQAQLDADAVVRLRLRNALTDSEGVRAEQRIINRLARELSCLPKPARRTPGKEKVK